MAESLVVGCATIALCLVIQCVVLSVMLRGLFAAKKRGLVRPTLVAASCLLVATMMVVLAGNLVQMTVWAAVFQAFGEFEDFATAFYHSVVNFSTLGYGDLVMSEERRLLGALEAANGVLMFALSASFLYAILGALMEQAWNAQVRRLGESNS